MSLGAYSSVVEPPAHNRLVPGSNPGGPTNNIKKSKQFASAFFLAELFAFFIFNTYDLSSIYNY